MLSLAKTFVIGSAASAAPLAPGSGPQNGATSEEALVNGPETVLNEQPADRLWQPIAHWAESIEPERVGWWLGEIVWVSGIIMLLAFVAYRLLSKLISKYEAHRGADAFLGPVMRLVLRWLVVVLTLAALLQAWGVLNNVWTAITATVTLVAIGFFAVWSVLSNILCSVVLMLTQPFRLGDRVSLPELDLEGRVYKVGLVYTRLSESDGAQLQIPNNMFFQKAVRRYPASGGGGDLGAGEASGAGEA